MFPKWIAYKTHSDPENFLDILDKNLSQNKLLYAHIKSELTLVS